MASKGTVPIVLLLALAVLMVGLGGGVGTTPAPTPGPGGGTTVAPAAAEGTTNIPGGALLACSGWVISTETADLGDGGGLTLQVFYAPENGGRNCALVSKTGTARRARGVLTTTLQFHSYDGRRWPRYAIQRLAGEVANSDAIYIDQSNRRCVRAWARFRPVRGPSVSLTSGKVGCR